MSKDTSTLLNDARQTVTELNADHERLSGLVKGAEQRLRDARRGDELAMRKAALEVAGLREALADVERERATAHENLDELEHRAQIEADEAELANIRTQLQRVTKDAINAINAAADAALASMQHAAKAEDEGRQLHRRMTELLAGLGQPAPGQYQPPGYRAVLAARKNAVHEDDELLRTLMNAARQHPVARGLKNTELNADRHERSLNARLKSAQTVYDSRVARVQSWHRGEVRDDEIPTVKQYAEWLQHTKRPETVADLEATP